MKYYLETNALLQISKIPTHLIINSYTSYLSLFELISGINSEKEYKIRKLCVQRILTSGILILKESEKTRIWHMYGVKGLEDHNIIPTFAMADALAASTSLESFSNFIFLHKNIKFNLASYIESDCKISTEAVQKSRSAATILSQGDKKNIPTTEKITFEYLDIEAHRMIIKFGVTWSNKKTYFWLLKAIENYHKGYMSIFMRAICIIAAKSLKNNVIAPNDIFDIGHLAYIEKGGKIVSNDNIYRKIAPAIGLDILSFTDYVEIKE